jgi:tetratricopeptide (TPR) repeat protein
MKSRSFAGALGVGLGALLMTVALADAASAQTGGVRGKVVDEAGKPVQDVVVVLDSPEGLGTATLKTDAKGEFFRIGMRPGDYSVKATKGPLSASLRSMHVGIGDPTSIETLTIRAGGAKPAADASGKADAAALAKKQAELQSTFKEGRALADAGKFDEAIAAYNKVLADVAKCSQCYVGLGDVHVKKGSLPEAEAAFKKATEVDPTSPDGYSALATFYNTQKKFEEAGQASAKAMELSAAKGSTDPLAAYNQGIILWNQSKIAEAKAQFQKAVELDPKIADAHYWLGMAWVNEGKMPEGGKEMTEYLKLSPTGEHADVAKAILAQIK